jgi:hypothetical protein
MANTINADSRAISGTPGVKTTADTSGVLALQADGTTIATLTTSGGNQMVVSGVVQSSSGGFKFPDNTTQTTAATSGISTGKAIAIAMIFG